MFKTQFLLPSRRDFLKTSAAGALTMLAGDRLASLSLAEESPNERLNIAAIGCTGRAGANIAEVASQNIVAICDVDQNLLDQAAERYGAARKYRDFREMLDKEASKIDAVVVGTPDHTHAPAAAMALRLKKHVYCEKPLTHTVFEARTLANLAAENKLVTQMGNQIHAGDNYRRVVELVQGGAIGPVRNVHVWVNVNYSGAKFTTDVPAPANLDWDLWLGPSVSRPYSEGVHPFNWRRFWDYGSGGLGDFGCHYIDLAHWALNLRAPTSVETKGPAVDPVSTPPWVIANYEYPSRDNMPAVQLTWYDGGKQPEILGELRDSEGKPLDWPSGQLFIGDNGMLISDYGRHLLLPADMFADFKAPEPSIPTSIGHHAEWMNAIKNGGPTTCNFDYAGALTEAVLLGVASFRSGKKIEWDAANLKVTNSPEAQPFIHKEYRQGWTL